MVSRSLPPCCVNSLLVPRGGFDDPTVNKPASCAQSLLFSVAKQGACPYYPTLPAFEP